MRCPRCGFEGSLLDGRCGRCGYRLMEVTQMQSENPLSQQTGMFPPVQQTGPLPRISGLNSGGLAPVQRMNMTPPPFSLTIGQLLRQGRYRLRERMQLAESLRTRGEAWLASDLYSRPEQLVVVRPVPLFAQNGQDIQTVLTSLAHIKQHPALPTIIDAFEEENHFYIVFEHIEGISLTSLIKGYGGALPERTIAEYGRQLCDILTFFSRQRPPFVHGSITPDSIVVSYDESKIALIHLPIILPDKLFPGSTNPYSAPEQSRGTVVAASDLYSVAAVMHHALTGYDPRERMNFFYPPARRLNPKVSQRMEEILVHELHLSLSQRYPRATDMQSDLTALISTYPMLNEEEIAAISGNLNIASKRAQLSSTQLRQWSRNRSMLRTGVVGLISLVLLLALSLPLLLPLLAPNTPTGAGQSVAQLQSTEQAEALNALLIEEATLFNEKRIGLSDGRFIFDTFSGRNKTGLDLKLKAAEALRKGDQSSAINLLSKAVSVDPTDGEARIYNENLHILQSKLPYVTIVLGVGIDENADDLIVARDNLRGAFLAQEEINQRNLLPNGLKLRILIDNCGANRDDVAKVAQLVANRVNSAGNPDTIIGVVGWPFSSQAESARDIIASAKLAMISPTASSDSLSGKSPYFFRVNPPDSLQGDALGKIAVNELGATRILVLRDPTDLYSNSLADAFTKSAKAMGAEVINSQENTFTEFTTTVEEYQKVVDNTLNTGADLLFIAGFVVDGTRLAHAVGNAARANPFLPVLTNIKILGGDGLSVNVEQSDGPESKIAKEFPQDMQRLIFTSFSHPDVWDLLNIPSDKRPPFLQDWKSFYQSSSIAEMNASPASNDAILANDGVHVFAKATTLVKGDLNGQKVRDALVSLGKEGVPAYQGVSGRILFDEEGNPIEKALVLLTFAPDEQGQNTMKLLQVVGKFQ